MRRKCYSLAVRLAFVCLCSISISPPAFAQTIASATVTGTARDNYGVLPGTTIEIRNKATNQVWTALTDARGGFRVLYLPVGDYVLSAEVAGFRKAVVDLSLAVGDQVNVPIALEPAGVTFVDEVVGESPLVATRRTELASAVTPQ